MRADSTVPVVAVNVPETAPALMLIDPGTERAALSSDRVTSAPDDGAGPERVTLHVAELVDCKPSGEQDIELRAGCDPASPPPPDGTN